MSTRTKRRTGKAEPVASVNLLSPWVFEDLRVHRLRRRFVYGAIALVVAIGLFWTDQRLSLHQAEQELRGEEAVTTGLSEQIDGLTPVRTYVEGVQHRAQTVHDATYADVAFSQVMEALRSATPNGAEITTISVDLAGGAGATGTTTTTPPATTTDPNADPNAAGGAEVEKDPGRGLSGATCPGPDPFGTRVVVGCVTLEGTAADRETVGKLVIALGDSDLFVEPFVSTTTTSDSANVTFSGSVGLSPKVFSGRYDSLGQDLMKEQQQ